MRQRYGRAVAGTHQQRPTHEECGRPREGARRDRPRCSCDQQRDLRAAQYHGIAALVLEASNHFCEVRQRRRCELRVDQFVKYDLVDALPFPLAGNAVGEPCCSELFGIDRTFH